MLLSLNMKGVQDTADLKQHGVNEKAEHHSHNLQGSAKRFAPGCDNGAGKDRQKW